jgi:hypothetical protein
VHCFLREYRQTANSYSVSSMTRVRPSACSGSGPSGLLTNLGSFWVFYVRIEEAHRGKGYGRLAMELAETEVRSRAASELGLNVFGHNQVARRVAHRFIQMGAGSLPTACRSSGTPVCNRVYASGRRHTLTCQGLSPVKGERSHHSHRCSSVIPAIRAIRSNSAGHTYRKVP